MARRWWPRAVVATGIAGGLVVVALSVALTNGTGTPAQTEPPSHEIPLRQSSVRAADFEPARQSCADHPFADIDAHSDGWHFVVDGDDTNFVEARLTFDDGSGTVPVTVPGSKPAEGWSGVLTSSGGRFTHAWVITPAGWTLLSGEADVTGTDPPDRFQLSHTCVGRA